MTLQELMQIPAWAAKTDEQAYIDLMAEETVPATEIHVPAQSVAAVLDLTEVAAWRTYTGPQDGKVLAAWEIFRCLLARGDGTIRAEKLVEQATGLNALGIIGTTSKDAAIALTVQTRLVKDGLGLGKVSPYLISEVR